MKPEDRLRISKRFKKQRDFLLELMRNPGNRLEELLELGFEEALMLLIRFGLGRHANEFRSQIGLAEEFGVGKCMSCLRINAALLYLGYTDEEIGNSFKEAAKRLENRVIRRRKKYLAEQEIECKKKGTNKIKLAAAISLGIDCLPIGLSIENILDFKSVFIALRKGNIDGSNAKHRVILLRFGLSDGRCKSLREVKEITGHCTLTITRWEREVLKELRG